MKETMDESCTNDSHLSAARLFDAKADKFLKDQRYDEALTTYRQGIAELGSDYSLSGTLDDTQTRLSLAQAKEREGDLSVATNLTSQTLKDRIGMMLTKCKSRD